MPKILWINYTWDNSRGAPKVYADLIPGLKCDDVDIITVFPRGSNDVSMVRSFTNNGIKIYNIPIAFITSIASKVPSVRQMAFNSIAKNVSEINKIILLHKCDLVVSNTTTFLEGALAAAKAGIGHLVFIHGVLNPVDFKVDEVDFEIIRKTEKIICNLSQLAVVQSKFTGKLWSHQLTPEKIVEIPLGIKVSEAWAPLVLNGGNPLIVLTLSSIEHIKNILFLVDTANEMKKTGYPVKFFVYGGIGDNNYKEEVNKKIKELKLDDYIKLCGFSSNIDELFLKSHILFVSSNLETFSLPIIEAMARCRPVISVRNGGPEDIIIDGETGFLINHGNVVEAAEKVSYFIKNPNSLEKMGLAGRIRYEKYYYADNVINKWKKLLIEQSYKTNEHDIKNYLTSEEFYWFNMFLNQTNSRIDDKSRWLIATNLDESNPSLKLGLLYGLDRLVEENIMDYRIVKPEEATAFLEWADVLLFVRNLDNYSLRLLDKAKKMGLKTIYYTDDDLTNIPDYAANADYYNSRQVQQNIFNIVSGCDLLLTCSIWLADLLKFKFNVMTKSIRPVFLPNARAPFAGENTKIVVGFAGNIDYGLSLEKLQDVYLKLFNKFSDVVNFEFIGPKPSFLNVIKGIHFPPVSFDHYRMLIARRGWDIGVAYLEDNQFNNAKFINKYIEYSLNKIAGIYSDIPLYRRVIVNHQNGLLASNHSDDWYQAIASLIQDTSLRKEIASNAYNDVADKYTPSEAAKEMREIFKHLLNYRSGSRLIEENDSLLNVNSNNNLMLHILRNTKKVLKKIPPVRNLSAARELILNIISKNQQILLNHHVPVPSPMMKNRYIYKIFVERSGLCGIKIMIGTHNRINQGKLKINIYSEKKMGVPIRILNISLESLVDNQWTVLKFEPIKASKNQKFTLYFDAIYYDSESGISIYEYRMHHSKLDRIVQRFLMKRRNPIYVDLQF